MAVEVRPAEPSDRPLLLALSEAAFGVPASPAEWAWKYDANPNAAVSVIAVDGERAVGFFGGLGTRYRGAGRDVPGAATVDVMTHPDARRLGHRFFQPEVEPQRLRAPARIRGEPHLGHRPVVQNLDIRGIAARKPRKNFQTHSGRIVYERAGRTSPN